MVRGRHGCHQPMSRRELTLHATRCPLAQLFHICGQFSPGVRVVGLVGRISKQVLEGICCGIISKAKIQSSVRQ